MHRRLHPRLALAAAGTLTVSALAFAGTSSGAAEPAMGFDRVATYPVFQNSPAGVDPSVPTVAEISAVSSDGKTVIHTDALSKRIGFVDISDPAAPKGAGTLSFNADTTKTNEPTSVTVVGNYALVLVDRSPLVNGKTDFKHSDGSLEVVDLTTKQVVRSIQLGGGPDSITVSADKKYAAIAIENERDETVKNDTNTGSAGDLPQAPAGYVQLLDLPSPTAPGGWSLRKVSLSTPEAQTAMTNAGLDTPSDPEPEYVAINPAGTKLALTLQENNGIVIIDLATGGIDKVFSAGTPTINGVDTVKDGLFNPTGTVTVPREPDSIAWVDNNHVATANEGDWKGGSRGWTVFEVSTGTVKWDAGNTFENIATAHGLHNNDRAGKKGPEPEGLAIAMIGGKTRAFVGSERSNFVAVYDMTNPVKPVFEQVLPTTNGPEGILPVPARDLLVVSSEVDDPAKNVRSTVSVYQYGRKPSFPSIVSVDESNGMPIGWGALGALSAAPGNPGAIWAASDSAYKQGRLYKVDVTQSPARIDRVVVVKNADGTIPGDLDIEGLSARVDGGFWAASEGATGSGNKLVRLSDAGVIQQEVTLPAGIAAKVGKWGFEGVTSTVQNGKEVLYAVLQRPLFGDVNAATPETEGHVTRIGRYDVAAGTWSWYTYPLETTSVTGDWMGVSEVTMVDSDTLAIIERDKLNGPAAAVKRVYTVDLPNTGGTEAAPVALTKKLAVDVLPALRNLKGWTQEKLEGLTIGADAQVYVVTDNDGLVDATGETQFLRLGSAAQVFNLSTTPTSSPTSTPTSSPTTSPTSTPTTTPTSTPTKKATTLTGAAARVGRKVQLIGVVSPQAPGKVVFSEGKRTLGKATLRKGVARLLVKLKRGKHTITVTYLGDSMYAGSTAKVRVRVR